MKNWLKKYKCVVAAVLAGVFALLAWGAFAQFYTTYDALVSFTANNFSNSITAAKPARVELQISEKNFEYIYLRLSANSEESLACPVDIRLQSTGGEVLFESRFTGAQLANGRYVNITPSRALPKGERCTLLLSSNAQTDEEAWRLVIGRALSTDVTAWYCGENEETIAEKPEIHTVYPNHLGLRTFGIYVGLCLLTLAVVLLPRTRFWQKSRWPVSALLLAVAPAVLLYFLELLCMNSLPGIAPRLLVCNYLLVLGIELLALALSGRPHVALVVSSVLCAVVGVANHFVLLFRGTPIAPSDLFAIGAAANVVAHYSFRLDVEMLLMLAAYLLLVCLGLRYRAALRITRLKTALVRAAALALSVVVLLLGCTPVLFAWSGASLDLFDNVAAARRNGVLYNFVQNIPSLVLRAPAGYQTAAATALAESYVPPTQPLPEQMPDIVLLMSEAWADYSQFADLSHLTQDAQPFFHAVQNDTNPRTLTGSTVTPVYGGGTCNSEFEAITGFSMRGINGFPYLQYVTAGTPSLATHLESLGYTTTALHPGIEGTWNRSTAYRSLGFDQTYFDVDFSQQIRNRFIADEACFDKILSELPQNDTDAPAFMFAVTIQNHGAYFNPVGYEMVVNSTTPNELFLESERYHSLLHYSDAALQDFVEQLSRRSRPTLFIMFGDHLPAFNTEYLSYIHYDQAVAEDPLTQYTTPYLIWANYDLPAEVTVPATLSTNYLGVMTLQLAGLPQSGWYQFLSQLMADIPIYSPADIRDAAGHSLDAAADERLATYEAFQYGAMREATQYPSGFFTP